MKRILALVGWLLAGVGAIASIAAGVFVSRGISSRPEPARIERELARAARHRLIPVAARGMENPVAAPPEARVRARAHFADHCAGCHGNDGRGETTIGRRLFPRAPDMTAAATQRLSDGELFWIIENGVRHTGMPGFGDDDPTNDGDSWELVHFVRALPSLAADDLAEMAKLNPTLSRVDLEHEIENERFLAGDEGSPAATEPHGH